MMQVLIVFTQEYQALRNSNITVFPEVNQFEVSPAMFRADEVAYFQKAGIIVSSSKALHRGASFDNPQVQEIAAKHSATPAQVFLCWGLQKNLVVVAKTINKNRMVENRGVGFVLDGPDVAVLDKLTTEEAVTARRKLEIQRKSEM